MVITLARMGAGIELDAQPVPAQSVDWRAVLELSVQHRVAPLVLQALAKAPVGSVPPAILGEFEAHRLRGLAGRMICESVLSTLLNSAAMRGIDILVLKGAALANELYPRPELRAYSDLDILCRPTDFPRLAAALLDAGCRRVDSNDVAGLKPPLDISRTRNFVDQSGDVLIEIHLDVLRLGIPSCRHGDFWRGTRTIGAGPLHIPTLSPTNQLLHLAVHAHSHCYSRLIWLIDMDLHIRRHGAAIDWPRLLAAASDEGVEAVLRHVLATLHAILGTPVPTLPRANVGQRCLGLLYRPLWPLAKVRRLKRSEHLRLLRFHPGTGDPRDVYFSLLLLGRRREKWRALRRHQVRSLALHPT